jgi:twitching motility protein PilT
MQQNILEYINYFDKMLVAHVNQGVTEFHLNPGENLKIKVKDAIIENPALPLKDELIQAAVKKLISDNQNRSVESVEHKDFLEVSGGNLEYDIYIETPHGLKLKTLRSTPHVTEKGLVSLKMIVEPEIAIGYSESLEIARIEAEDKFELWFDDFTSKILAMNNPRPKDIILHPNKKHPFLTVTGGLRPITDVVISPGITNRIARMLVRLSHNPSIEAVLARNNNSFDTLDIDLAYKTRAGRRFRVNIADIFDTEHEHGCLITMRLLPEKPFTVDELRLPKVLMDTIFNLKMGLILISGTTGSGKSTTMGALIDFLLKTKSVNLLTIENPIETLFPSQQYPKSTISQREVGKHSLSQSKAMESAVRQTLNIAMVGEIRNDHDAMMAIELAQSGHLIFATLHAGSTGESIDRIVEMFPSDQSRKVRDLLAAQYKMGVAQTLVKGLQGQTELALEIFKTNNDIKGFITKNQEKERQFSMREIIEMYSGSGSLSYDQCLVQLFNEGKINEDIMMFNSPDQDALIYRQGKLGVKLTAKWDPVGSKLDKAMDDILIRREQAKKAEANPQETRVENLEAVLSKIELLGEEYSNSNIHAKTHKFDILKDK